MPTFTDQLGRKIDLKKSSIRIISLVPSITELLYDLGLKDEVIGITKFCVHPSSWKKEKTIIGGTKNFRVDQIKSLNPDLVIANKEENTEEGIKAIAAVCPTWISDVQDITSAFEMIEGLGKVLSKEAKAQNLVSKIKRGMSELTPKPTRRAVYLIWKGPYMAAGSDTFISSMMTIAGYENLIQTKRYPSLSIDELRIFNPEVVLLSSEPYPCKEKHLKALETELNCEIKLVDGELFSRYGSKMLKAVEVFKKDGEAPAAPPV